MNNSLIINLSSEYYSLEFASIGTVVNHISSIRNIQQYHFVICVLPISGDNDISDICVKKIQLLLKLSKESNPFFIIIFTGNYHISDQLIINKYPVAIKIYKLLKNIDYHFFRKKLNRYNISIFKARLENIFQEPVLKYRKIFNKVNHYLADKPVWNIEKGLVDFYDNKTGFSLLINKDKDKLLKIFKLINSLDIKIILLKHAKLKNNLILKLFEDYHQLQILDITDNYIKQYNSLINQLNSCEWISFAVNNLSEFHLEVNHEHLKHLYLHKNQIHSISINNEVLSQLKTLSLFRNQLSHFKINANNIYLERLNIGANPIEQVPECIHNMSNLKFLGLANTNITTIPNWLIELPKLQELDVSYIEQALSSNQLKILTERNIKIITRPNE